MTSYENEAYNRVSVIMSLSCKSAFRLYVQLVSSRPEYFTWCYTEDYFHFYVPLSSTAKFLSPDLDRITEIPLLSVKDEL